MLRKTRAISMLILFLLAIMSGWTQTGTDYGVHANIIYQFTKYINWPKENPEGSFVIGVIGDCAITSALEKISAVKKVAGKEIVVRRFSPTQADYEANILFIPHEEKESIKRIVARTAGQPLLIVSESEGMARKGACINFAVRSERLILEINQKVIEIRTLDIASELLKLGKIVN